MKLQVFFAVLFAFQFSVPVEARVVETSKVRYQTEGGQSQWYRVEVTYMTSDELNAATGSSRYGFVDEYAIIFWDDRQATVIKLNNLLFCYGEFEQSCFPTFGNMKGKDQQDRVWEICTSTFC